MDEQQWIEERDHIRARRRDDLAAAAGRAIVRRGSTFHRPDELLLDPTVAGALVDVLRDHGAEGLDDLPDQHWRTRSDLPVEHDLGRLNGALAEPAIDLRLVTFAPHREGGRDMPALARELHERVSAATQPPDPDDDLPVPAVHLNRVMFAESPVYQGGPGGEPFVIPALPPHDASGRVPAGPQPDIAVLDTGLPLASTQTFLSLGPVISPNANDFDLLFRDDGDLATQAAHGLFICALVHRLEASLRIDPGRVLDQYGIGDDASVTAELRETTAPVINLSLGGYTDGDVPPPALQRAIEALLAQGRVVVAAAGNNSSDRPFFPAALKGVIAVGAYDSTGGGTDRAPFSNHGPWVDVWAPGVSLRSQFASGTWAAHDGPREFSGAAGWSGTSFAAPQVATEIARRFAALPDGATQTARQVCYRFLAELETAAGEQGGLRYQPRTDLTQLPEPTPTTPITLHSS